MVSSVSTYLCLDDRSTFMRKLQFNKKNLPLLSYFNMLKELEFQLRITFFF